MEYLYHYIRPFITAGDIQNRESVQNTDLVNEAIALEKAKYNVTFIMNFFYKSIFKMISAVLSKSENKNVLDVGSAIGEVISQIANHYPDVHFNSVDIMSEAIQHAQKNFSGIKNLKFQKKDFIHDDFDSRYQLVMCMQTLEHIEDGYLQPFIERLFKVSHNSVIVTVPREPFWCIANIVRFKYWNRLGNSPHHIQHWSKRSFKKLILAAAEKTWGPNLEVKISSPLFLWTIMSVTKKI